MFNRSDIVYVFLIIVCCELFVISKCQLCEDTRISYTPTVVCQNINGKFPPRTKPVSSIRCTNCYIPIVDESTITNFNGETFNLSFAHVQKINSNAFKSFQKDMHKFLFESNDISYIAPKVFSNFSSLDDIVLKKNNIAQLSDGVFDNTSVANLDLSYNRLSNLSNIFTGLKVNALNLSYNEIVIIPQSTFENTTFWRGRQWRQKPQQIDFSNNYIRKIYPNTFKSIDRDNTIVTINLKNNKLTTIENNTFNQLSLLTWLSLEGNSISELQLNSFKGMISLNTLILRNNVLTKIPQGMFADLDHLEILDLSLNQLTTFTISTFSGLSRLLNLNISHNNLRVLDDSHILPLGQLLTLDISDTKLQDLNLPAILEHHYKLRVLIMNDNFWMCKHLVQMYKQMNERMGGFDVPTHHYDVPNLHGIACSRTTLDSYSAITFDDFLAMISQDRVFEDMFDSRVNNEYTEFNLEDISRLFASIYGIYNMLVLITIICILLFVQFTIKYVCLYFYRRNILPDNKKCFAYTSSDDNVELI